MSTLPPEFTEAIEKTNEWLDQELGGIRTGRASPALIEQLKVESYGSMTPLQQLAAIQSPEPQLLVVQPWDPSLVKDIERAITQSSLGVNPVVDGKIIRLPFPPMTEERRISIRKVVKEKGEQAKVRVRNAREDVMKDFKKKEKDGRLSEDALELAMKQVQEEVEKANAMLEDRVAKKMKEVETV